MATMFLLILILSQRIMATQDHQDNWKIILSAKINGPTSDEVWPFLEDFCNIYKIFPVDVSFCVQGTNGKSGNIRYAAAKYPSQSEANATIVFWASEELLAIDARQKYVTYAIDENNRGLCKLVGTMQVLPDDENGCTFKWSIVVAPVDGYTYEGFVDFLEMNLAGMVSRIENIIGG